MFKLIVSDTKGPQPQTFERFRAPCVRNQRLGTPSIHILQRLGNPAAIYPLYNDNHDNFIATSEEKREKP